MRNPWEELRYREEQWLLPEDREAIETFNGRAKPEHRIQLAAMPEPFIGSPDTARLVFLGLNPGFSPAVPSFHKERAFQDAILKNLRREEQRYAFYPLNPEFSHAGAATWWRKRLRTLRDDCGLPLELFAQKVMALEWFPYPSKSAGIPHRRICPSQDYSFFLLSEFLKRKNIIVLGMRARSRWANSGGSKETPFLNSPMASYVTPSNMPPGLYAKIVEHLRQRE